MTPVLVIGTCQEKQRGILEGALGKETEGGACDLGQVPEPLGAQFSCLKKRSLKVSLQLTSQSY